MRHPAGYLFFRIWLTSLPKPMGYPSAQRRCQPFLWAASSGSIFKVSPFKYLVILSSEAEREMTASASSLRIASASG